MKKERKHPAVSKLRPSRGPHDHDVDNDIAAERMAGAWDGFQTRLLAIMLGMAATIAVWYFQPKYQWELIERHCGCESEAGRQL